MIFRDKHIRYYCGFIFVLVLLFFLIEINIINAQTTDIKEMIVTHDNAIATYLLEQEVPKEVIA